MVDATATRLVQIWWTLQLLGWFKYGGRYSHKLVQCSCTIEESLSSECTLNLQVGVLCPPI